MSFTVKISTNWDMKLPEISTNSLLVNTGSLETWIKAFLLTGCINSCDTWRKQNYSRCKMRQRDILHTDLATCLHEIWDGDMVKEKKRKEKKKNPDDPKRISFRRTALQTSLLILYHLINFKSPSNQPKSTPLLSFSQLFPNVAPFGLDVLSLWELTGPQESNM